MKEIVIVGAGNHVKVVLDILEKNNQKVLAILDDDEKLIGNKVFDVQVIGKTSLLDELSPDKYEVIISVGKPENRSYLFQKIKALGFSFINAIHPDTSISTRVKYGEGIIFNAGVTIHPDVVLNDDIILGMNSTISHDVIVGSHSHISPGVHITGECKIGNSVEMGTGAVVLPGLSIGDNTIIGAGAVVTKDITEAGTYIGVPAKVINKN